MFKNKKIILVFILLQIAIIFGANNTYAANNTDLLNKALANALQQCYTDAYMKKEVLPGDVYKIDNVITDGGTSSTIVKLPTQIGNSIKNASISCKQLFTGVGGAKKVNGLLQGSSLTKASLLDTIGYKSVDSSSGGKCYYISYSYQGNTSAKTNAVCDNYKTDSSENGPLKLFIDSSGAIILVDTTTFNPELTSSDNGNGDYMYKVVVGEITKDKKIKGLHCGSYSGNVYSCSEVVTTDKITKYERTANSAKIALTNLTGFKSFDEAKFTQQDAYDLYVSYLFGPTSIYSGLYTANCKDNKNDNSSSIPVLVEEKVQWCEVLGRGRSSKDTVNVLPKGNWQYLSESADIDGIIKHIRDLDTSKLNLTGANSETGAVDDTVDQDEDGSDAESISCLSSGAAKSLGWIACPILDWMASSATDAYEYLKPSLTVEPTLFSGAEGGAEDGWKTFRDLANILFVILFLVVIFSQLTGVGIDNYGIKKILPKLIVAAILINLSYLLCMITVDISNIVGNGFQDVFNSIGSSSLNYENGLSIECKNDIEACTDGYYVMDKQELNGIATGGLVSVGLIAALATSAAAVILNPAILLSLLVSGLSIVIAIFFLFLLLAAREAAIVVLVVISPLAVACYMLPNTKKYFDRWIKLFGGLLLVYPICGLLVGGGNYVSKLLISTNYAGNGFFRAFTAMIVGVVPIFFIPTVLKSSFSAMGNLGGKISSIGKQLGGRADKAARNTDAYKNIQERGLERKARIQGGFNKNNQQTKLSRAIGSITSGGKRGRQRSAIRYDRMMSDRGSLEATEGEDYLLTTETDNEMKRIVSTGEVNDMAGLRTSLTSALVSGDRAKIRAYTDALSAKGEDGREGVKAAYDKAVALGASNSAKKTWADNILAKHSADYKNNNRSVFEVAKDINLGNNSGVTTSDFLARGGQEYLANRVSAGTIASMDDEAFHEVFGGYGTPASIPSGFDPETRSQIGAIAYAALNDQNANIKTERRQALQTIFEQSGYQPPAENVVLQDVRLKDAEGRRQQTDTLRVSLEGSQASSGVVTTSGGSASNASQDSSSTLVNTSSAPADGRAVENETFTVDQTTGTGGNSSRPVVNHLPIPEGWEVDPNYTGNPSLINDNNRTGLRRISNPGNGVNTSNRGRDMSGTDWNVPRSNRN